MTRRLHAMSNTLPPDGQRAMMTTTATNRIRKEWTLISREKNPLYTVELVKDNLYHWQGTLDGPENSPYEAGRFRFSIQFHANYPFAPPTVRFLQPIYHPNISQCGSICLDILKHQWAPALTISKVLLSLISLLCDPNPSDPLVQDAAYQYSVNRTKYDAIAKDWTSRYALPKPLPAVKKDPFPQ